MKEKFIISSLCFLAMAINNATAMKVGDASVASTEVTAKRRSRLKIHSINTEPGIKKLNPMQYKKSLDEVIAHALSSGEEETSVPHISDVTPEEAASYFTLYIAKTLGDNFNVYAGEIFSPKYFGFTFEEAPRKSTDDLVRFSRSYDSAMTSLRNRSWAPSLTEINRAIPFELALRPFHEVVRSYVKLRPWLKEEQIYTDPKFTKVFREECYGLPEEPAARKEMLLKKQFEFVTPTFIKEVLQSANKILNHSKQGDKIVIFGNTPYFVGYTLKKLISRDPRDPTYRQMVEFPFSGAPNTIRPGSMPNHEDVVTKERHIHLMKRLKNAGLTHENESMENFTTHFVDVIGSGAGLSYVIEEILKEFIIFEKPLPDFQIQCLNEIDIENKDDLRNLMIAEDSARDGESTTFYFPNKENKHFEVPAVVSYLHGHAYLDMLPSSSWRIFRECNAAYWHDIYDEFRINDSEFTRVLHEYFDVHLDVLLADRT